ITVQETIVTTMLWT
nr:immunoglobulin heavy chain junction region [Mus musculus]